MFILLVLVSLGAGAAGFVATREAFRSQASPEALVTLLAVGIVCAGLLGSASPIAIPAALCAAIGLALGLNVERRRRDARPALTLVHEVERTSAVTRRAA